MPGGGACVDEAKQITVGFGHTLSYTAGRAKLRRGSFALRECRELGFLPIIAHPERYFFLQDDPSLAYEFCVSGYGLQVNKGSLLGSFGPAPRRMADLILDHGLCACVASDAHRPYERSTYMIRVRDYLAAEYGEEYMRLLLEENPARILSGRELLGYEPIPF